MWDIIVRYRAPHFHKDFPIVLFWSQKSGCTTLAKWFYHQIGLLDEAMEYNQWIHAYDQEVYKNKVNYLKAVLPSISSGEKTTIKLIRNPYKRAVSQFLILGTTEGAYWDKEWEKIRTVIYGNKHSERGITFKQFLTYIRDYRDMADNHFHPQYVAGEEFFVKKYIRLENFSKEIRKLERKYGLKKTDLSQFLQSPHHLSKSMVVNCDFSNVEITKGVFISNRELPTYESFYDSESISMVNSIFHNDFIKYGYKKLSGVPRKF